MKRLQALAEAADLLRRYRPWSDDADKLDAQENPRARRSPKALDRMHACTLGVIIQAPFGAMRRIEAQGETWEEAIESLRYKCRRDRLDYGGMSWLIAMMDCAADGTLDTDAARQFRAWVDHEEEGER